MGRFLIRLVITALTLYVAIALVPGLHWTGEPVALLGVALVFGVVNAFLKPLLTILTCPLVVITLGLFMLVVNAVLLLITARLSQALGLGFTIDGFWPAFWGGLLIGLASTVLTAMTGAERRRGEEHG
ncbi:MAG: phage holin family protein [Gemmatimonadales bacterium]